jgi:hypothetical protein
MVVTPHDRKDLDRLRQCVRKEGNAKQRDRYHVVLLALAEGPRVQNRVYPDYGVLLDAVCTMWVEVAAHECTGIHLDAYYIAGPFSWAVPAGG